MRLLDRLGIGDDALEADELALIARFLFRPDRLHRLDPLPQHLPAAREVGAVIGHLLPVPAAAYAEQQAPAGEVVERRRFLGQHDGVALDDEADGRADPDGGGRARRRHQRHERVGHVVVGLRQGIAARIGRLAARRNMRVLADPEGFEAPLLGGLRQLVGPGPVFGVVAENAELHRRPLRRAGKA